MGIEKDCKGRGVKDDTKVFPKAEESVALPEIRKAREQRRGAGAWPRLDRLV